MTRTLTEPIFPDVKMNLVPPTKPVTGRVVSNRLCMKGKSASFVRHVAVDVSGTPLAGQVHAGQSFGVVPPGTDEKGKPHKVRLYSNASPGFGEDGEGTVVSTTAKRLIDEYRPQSDKDDPDDHRLHLGVASNYICDLRVGDEIQVAGPNGKRFLLPDNRDDFDYLFIATGTGVAPFRGMLMELFEHPNQPPTESGVRLIMGASYTTDLLYDDWLRELEQRHENFTYETAISREMRSDGRKGGYVHQRLAERIDDYRDMLASPRTLIYICGLAGMQIGVFHELAKAGLGEAYLKIHDEVAGIDPAEWTTEQIKRRVRPTSRCMLEVY